MDSKSATDCVTIFSQIVMPGDTNHFGNLSGGKLMHWIDICGAQTAMLYSAQNVVTAAIDNVTFDKPIKQGQIAFFTGTVTWVGNTSMEVRVDVVVKDHKTGDITATNSAYTVFVAVDENMKPMPVSPLIVETNEALQEFERAKLRRENRIKLRDLKK